jgi:short-subunit dehydrogenase
MELDGRKVLLTGATGGLGRAIAKALAGRGATLVLSSRKAGELEQLAGSLPGAGHVSVVCDLAQEGSALTLL